MNVNIVLYVDEGLTDDNLTFNGLFLPNAMNRLIDILKADKIYYSVHNSYTGRLTDEINTITRDGIDNNLFWKSLLGKTGSDHIIKILADSPFLDDDIIAEMLNLHIEYMAEYTYSENLPPGLSCEIISKELIDALPDTERETLSLSGVIKSNINQFDIEIYYRDPDLRDKRISFRSGSKRDKVIMENLFRIHGKVPGYSQLQDLITENPDVLFIGPSYLEIELTGKCDLKCIFCYRESLESEHGNMDILLFERILEGMKEFNLPFSICFGGSGEPLMHPQFYEIAELALKNKLVEQLIVETNGIMAGSNYKTFAEQSGGSKLKTIININGLDGETYNNLHGKDHFQTVYSNIEELKKLVIVADQLFIQVMKINETEPFLDRYYDFWEKNKVPIILQKQNIYLGRVKDRRYSDLSPVIRTPCWHLQRDLYIHADGKAGFCKQDVGENIPGVNISDKSLLEIWKSRKDIFYNDYKKNYPDKPDCSQCDEWYTFNF